MSSKRMDRYGEIMRSLAGRHDAMRVDTQATFDAALADLHHMTLARDCVHLAVAGGMVRARAFLRGIGFAPGRTGGLHEIFRNCRVELPATIAYNPCLQRTIRPPGSFRPPTRPGTTNPCDCPLNPLPSPYP